MPNELKITKRFIFKIAEKKENQIRFLVFSALSVAVMILIFLFSAQNANDSAALSGEIGGWVEEFLNGFRWLLGEGVIIWIRTYIRKIAHFTLYTILGGFVSAAIFNTNLKNWVYRIVISAGIGLVYSITDEIHQLFVPGRAFQLIDILVDSTGALIGVIASFIILKF